MTETNIQKDKEFCVSKVIHNFWSEVIYVYTFLPLTKYNTMIFFFLFKMTVRNISAAFLILVLFKLWMSVFYVSVWVKHMRYMRLQWRPKGALDPLYLKLQVCFCEPAFMGGGNSVLIPTIKQLAVNFMF